MKLLVVLTTWRTQTKTLLPKKCLPPKEKFFLYLPPKKQFFKRKKNFFFRFCKKTNFLLKEKFIFTLEEKIYYALPKIFLTLVEKVKALHFRRVLKTTQLFLCQQDHSLQKHMVRKHYYNFHYSGNMKKCSREFDRAHYCN